MRLLIPLILFWLLLPQISLAKLNSQDSLLFWRDVWQTVNEYYIEADIISKKQALKIWQKIKIDSQKNPAKKDSILYAHICRMIRDLPDGWSYFLPPPEIQAGIISNDMPITEDIIKISVGLILRKIEQDIVVIRVIPGSAADSAKIKVGDKILSINDQAITSVEQADSLLIGPKNIPVKIIIQRPNEIVSREYLLWRQEYLIPSIDFEFLPDSILYVHFWNFRFLSAQQFAQAIENLSPKGIIIDLRDNPGGIVGAAIKVMSYWLKPEEFVCFVEFRENQRMALSIDDDYDKLPIFKNIPTVILVNNRTASASEIIVGAFQDYQKAVIVGQKTYGKGTLQRQFNFSRGAALVLTVAYWFTPFERQVNKVGLEPDVIIEPDQEDLISGRGVQFKKAIEILRMKFK